MTPPRFAAFPHLLVEIMLRRWPAGKNCGSILIAVLETWRGEDQAFSFRRGFSRYHTKGVPKSFDRLFATPFLHYMSRFDENRGKGKENPIHEAFPANQEWI